MKRTQKFAFGIATLLGLGLSVAAAYAQPGQMGGDKGCEGMEMKHAMAGMMHDMHGGMKHGAMGAGADRTALHSLMTPEEHSALMEKMHSAATPEERQKLAQATHAEMSKRAKEQGITLPGHDSSHAGHTN